ncbi:CYIR protein, partial [Plasmodium cynomolgi strain B]
MIHRMREEQVGPSSYNIKLKDSIVMKWSIRTIVMCLTLSTGLILPIYLKFQKSTSGGGPTSSIFSSTLGMPEYVYTIYCIFFIVLTSIILLSIIYTMTKVVKYHRLEDGRDKSNFK